MESTAQRPGAGRVHRGKGLPQAHRGTRGHQQEEHPAHEGSLRQTLPTNRQISNQRKGYFFILCLFALLFTR